jgi:hypothetical protein
VRSWAVEQLTAAARFPAASQQLRQQAAQFLALHAFFKVNASKAGKSKLREVKLAGSCRGEVTEQVRALCASRLITLIGQGMHTQHGQQQQQVPEAAPEPTPKAAKKRKGDSGQAIPSAAAAAPAAAAAGGALLQPLLLFVAQAQKGPACEPALELSEEMEAALSTLREVEGALCDAQAQQAQQAQQQGVRARALLQLVRLLQLYLLGGWLHVASCGFI